MDGRKGGFPELWRSLLAPLVPAPHNLTGRLTTPETKSTSHITVARARLATLAVDAAGRMPSCSTRPSGRRGRCLAASSPGERVAVWAPNLPEWVILAFGAALAG